jgi:hypothetical protein
MAPVVPGYRGAVGFFKWLYRLPGRIDRSLGPTFAATDVERGGGMGGVRVDPTAVGIVAEEIKESTGSNRVDDRTESPTSE